MSLLGPSDPRELGFYFALAQVGLEMVIPIAIGAVLDHYLEWTPWGAVVGAVLGLIVGLVHLVTLLQRQERENSSQKKRQGPP